MARSDQNGALEVEPNEEPTARPGKPAGKRKVKAGGKPVAKAKRTSKAANGNATPKTRQRDPDKLDRFGLRMDSLKSQAAAFYARSKGATLAEVKREVGSIQFNVIRELTERGFKFKRVEEDGARGRKATRYFLQAK